MSPDGRWILARTDGPNRFHGLTRWDAATGQPIESLWMSESLIPAFAFAPDSARMAFVLGGTKVVVQSIVKSPNIEIPESLAPIERLSFSPDGQRIVIEAGPRLVAYSLAGPRPDLVGDLMPIKTTATTACFRSDSRTVAFAALSTDGKPSMDTMKTRSGPDPGTVVTTPRSDDVFFAVAGQPELLVRSDRRDHSWAIYDQYTGQPAPRQKFVGHTAPVTCVAVSADRQWAVSGSEDHTLRMWEVNTGKLNIVLNCEDLNPRFVAMSADGSRLTMSDGTNKLLRWERGATRLSGTR
jgi:WD40 repeat protein